MFATPAYAQAAGAAQGGSTAGAIVSLLPLVLIFVVFYFLMIRPQQKRMKQQQEMINALNKGDKVITNGGIIGTIVSSNDAEVELEIASGVRVTVLRYSVYKKYDPAEFTPADKKSA